ncbi:MAG: hypothetical protein AAF688_12520 [Bacteroidota bacterium]
MKKPLLFSILIIVIALITSCEKNEEIILEEHGKNHVHRISLNEFTNGIKKDETYTKLKSYFYSNKKSTNLTHKRIEEGDEVTILTNEILLIQKNDINYYTFKLLTDNNGNEFYNLVVHANSNQEIIKSEIFEYSPTDLWLQDTTQPYSGYISLVPNNFIDLNTVFSKSLNDCITGAISYWNCGAGNNHAPGAQGCDPDNNAVTELIVQLQYGPCPEDDEPHFVDPPNSGDYDPNNNSNWWTPDGGGNSNNDSNDDDGDNTTPVIPTKPTVQEEILNCINGLYVLGSENQTSIDPQILEQLDLPKGQWNSINDNLQNNGCSEQAQQEAIDELLEEFDEQIFLDEEFENNNCLKSVYDSMGKASTFNNYLKNFEEEFSVAHLRFSSSSTLASNTNAETSPPNNYLITITFNENNLDRPNLSVARTMIHEMIHAEIFRKLLSAANKPNLNYSQYTDEEWRNFIISLRNNFEGIYDYYLRWQWDVPSGQSPSGAQHEAMAQHYRDIIEQALREYDPNQTDATYEALAWTGLMGSGVFDSATGLYENSTVAWSNLSQTERLNIISSNNTFNSTNSNCQN